MVILSAWEKIIMMVIICIVLSGVLYYVLSSFLKKLNKIEKDKWGDHA